MNSADPALLLVIVNDLFADLNPDWELLIEQNHIAASYEEDDDEDPDEDEDAVDLILKNCQTFEKNNFKRQHCAHQQCGFLTGEQEVRSSGYEAIFASKIDFPIFTLSGLWNEKTDIQDFDQSNLILSTNRLNSSKVSTDQGEINQYHEQAIKFVLPVSKYSERIIESSNLLLANKYLDQGYFINITGHVNADYSGDKSFLPGIGLGARGFVGSFGFEVVARSQSAVNADSGGKQMLKFTSDGQKLCVFSKVHDFFIYEGNFVTDRDCNGISE